MKCRALALALLLTGTADAGERMSFIDTFTESNNGQCVEFNFDGVSFYVKASASLFSGVAFNFYLSPIVSHYNPDLLVTAYARLGDSPLFESYITLGRGQNLVAKPLVEHLSGAEVPQSWDNTDDWSGQTSDPDSQSHPTLRYFEAEVFGHPGNVYTLASKAYRGESIAGNGGVAMLQSLPQNIAATPAYVEQTMNRLAGSSGTTLGEGFDDDAKARFNPVVVAREAVIGSIRELANNSGIGQALTSIENSAPDDLKDDAIAFYQQNILGQSIDQANEAVQTEDGEGTGKPTLRERLDIDGLPDKAVAALREKFGELSAENIAAKAAAEVGKATEKVQEVVALFNTLKRGQLSDLESLATPGVSVDVLDFEGFCPSDTQPFMPYFLSGTNVLSWRYKIPEIVYPQTYIPFSNQTTVGELLPGVNNNPFKALAETQNYGSVYPRNGYLLQSDALKGAAVTAFRAAHIVTRPGQPHIYRAATARPEEIFTLFDNGYDSLKWDSKSRRKESVYLEPHKDERGRWQLIHSNGAQTDQSCHRFGSPQVNPELDGQPQSRTIGNTINLFPVQWTENKVSEDNDYIFSLWRRYRCSPKVQGGFWRRHLGNFPLPQPVTIIQ